MVELLSLDVIMDSLLSSLVHVVFGNACLVSSPSCFYELHKNVVTLILFTIND